MSRIRTGIYRTQPLLSARPSTISSSVCGLHHRTQLHLPTHHNRSFYSTRLRKARIATELKRVMSSSAPSQQRPESIPPDDNDKTIYKITFFVPPSHTQTCLSALFAAGAGIWPNQPSSTTSPQNPPEDPKYTSCAFTTHGTGQFRPSATSNPHIGTAGGEIEYVQEDRVEVICLGTERCKRAVRDLRKAHPYEVCSVFVGRCEDF